ncbi:MAG: polysaccharide deacetylase family protein [Deltaproteobacteria bacterium]|nr:polysaccharide deacetylase family protein [Deltaproteobacteria bacterium]MBI4795082.1 polysaccharide deacetylase family protein [Deltaproteobacteria bacterium]
MAILADRRFNLHIAWGLVILLFIVAGITGPVNGAQPVTIWAGLPSEPEVALTFDDGPSPLYTPQILALLRKYQAHATFFVLGRKVEEYPGLVKAMLKEGHEVGNHSFSHPRLTKTDQLNRERELETTRLDLDLLDCPREHQLIRPPYSAFDDRLVSYAAHTGRQLVLWSIDSEDWRGLDTRTIAKNVLSRVRNGSIIVFHDSDEKDRADRQPTVEALKIILPALRDRGYRLVTIDEVMTENNH